MTQVLVALLFVLPLLRGPSIDPAGGNAVRRTIVPNTGTCIDPNGRPCVRANSLTGDKGLGVDPNG